MRLRTVVLSTMAGGLVVAGLGPAWAAGAVASASSGSSSASRAIGGAESRTAAAKTARLTVTEKLTGGPSFGTGSITAEGPVDFASRQAELTFTGDGSTVGGAPVVVVVVGSKAYVDGQAVGASKGTFVPAPSTLAASGSSSTSFSLQPSQVPDALPAQLLGDLAHLQGAHQVGKATLGGQATTEYGGTISGAALDTLLGIPAGTSSVGALPPAKVDVWIDHEGRLDRFETSIDLLMAVAPDSGSSRPSAPTVSLQEDLTHFGEPVHIPAVSAGSSTTTTSAPSTAPTTPTVSCTVTPVPADPAPDSSVELDVTGPADTSVTATVTRINGQPDQLAGTTDGSGHAELPFQLGDDVTGAALPVAVSMGTATCSTSIRPS